MKADGRSAAAFPTGSSDTDDARDILRCFTVTRPPDELLSSTLVLEESGTDFELRMDGTDFELRMDGTDFELTMDGTDSELRMDGTDFEIRMDGTDFELRMDGADFELRMDGTDGWSGSTWCVCTKSKRGGRIPLRTATLAQSRSTCRTAKRPNRLPE